MAQKRVCWERMVGFDIWICEDIVQSIASRYWAAEAQDVCLGTGYKQPDETEKVEYDKEFPKYSDGIQRMLRGENISAHCMW